MYRRFGMASLILLPALMLFAAGCGGGQKEEPVTTRTTRKTGTTTGGPKAKRTEFASKGWGKLVGKVTYDGMAPTMPPIKDLLAKMECTEHAKESEKTVQTWIVDKDGGVANVLIYLKEPKGSYFPVKDEDKNRKDEVLVNQPHCAFIPHIVALYPAYYDGKEYKLSGQTWKVKNSANFLHNFNWSGDPLAGNDGGNLSMPPGDIQTIVPKPQTKPINFSCNAHPWMNGKAWTFDHPYAAVTKEDGTFEIPHVPAGAEVAVVVWHEATNEWRGDGFEGADGKKMTFEDGKTATVNLKIKAP